MQEILDYVCYISEYVYIYIYFYITHPNNIHTRKYFLQLPDTLLKDPKNSPENLSSIYQQFWSNRPENKIIYAQRYNMEYSLIVLACLVKSIALLEQSLKIQSQSILHFRNSLRITQEVAKMCVVCLLVRHAKLLNKLG